MSSFEVVPGWAYSYCWFFFVASAVSALTAVLTLITIVTMFNELNRKNAVPLLSVYVFALAVQSITSMVTFWMCRSSLNPNRK
jgi:hypothetical protein